MESGCTKLYDCSFLHLRTGPTVAGRAVGGCTAGCNRHWLCCGWTRHWAHYGMEGGTAYTAASMRQPADALPAQQGTSSTAARCMAPAFNIRYGTTVQYYTIVCGGLGSERGGTVGRVRCDNLVRPTIIIIRTWVFEHSTCSTLAMRGWATRLS